jgi:RimJ/RimL family protein N-acetyltransferase
MLPVRAIQTARLELVPLQASDADEMVGVLADPALYSFTGDAPPDLGTLRDRYERQAAGRSTDGTQQWLNWIARLRDSGAAIGFAQATVRASPAQAEVAWLIGVPWQGRGFASEAASAVVEWLASAGVREIEAHIHPDHLASQAVARRAGLISAGTIDADGEQVWRHPLTQPDRTRPTSGPI